MFREPRRWPGYVATAILVVFVFKYPVPAAHLADGIVHLISDSATGLATFVSGMHLG